MHLIVLLLLLCVIHVGKEKVEKVEKELARGNIILKVYQYVIDQSDCSIRRPYSRMAFSIWPSRTYGLYCEIHVCSTVAA